VSVTLGGDDLEYVGTVGLMSGIDVVPTEFLWSIMALRDDIHQHFAAAGGNVLWVGAGPTDHAHARNQLVEAMRGDWLLMLDCDHYVEPDVLRKMLALMYNDGHDKPPACPVVTGLYFSRKRFWQATHGGEFVGRSPQLYVWDTEHPGMARHVDYLTMLVDGVVQRDQVFQIHACGGGILLVHRSVFERIRDELGEKPFDNAFNEFGRMSEDLSFCWRCHKLGIPIYCHPGAQSYHLERRMLSLDEVVRERAEALGAGAV